MTETTSTRYAAFFDQLSDMPNPPTADDLTQVPCPSWCEFSDSDRRGLTFPSEHELPGRETGGLSRQHQLTISDSASAIHVALVQDELAETVTGPATYSPLRITYTVEHADNSTPSDQITGHQARELAAYLIEAADEWDRYRRQPVV